MAETGSTPTTMAIIADTHGNRWALETALADIDRRGIGRIINLGDHLTGPLDPVATAALLMRREMVNILGNDDRDLFAPPERQSPSQRFTRQRLSTDQLDWLRAMPERATIGDEIFACHGDLFDAQYLLEQVSVAGEVTLRATRAIAASAAAATTRPVILSGHSHIPRTVALPGGGLTVNPGSMGLPAYTMDSPVPYAMESGSPHARYAILSKTPHGWQVEHVALPYPAEEAAAQARANGREDWAEWISTGRAR